MLESVIFLKQKIFNDIVHAHIQFINIITYSNSKGAKMDLQEQLQAFKSNLTLIRSMQGDKAEDQFYNLMEKAKKAFGEEHLYMAEFYFQYAKFIIEKLQKNIDIFNANQLPQEQAPEEEEEMIEYDADTSSEKVMPIQQNRNQQDNPEADQPLITEDNQKKVEEAPQNAGAKDAEQNNQENGNKQEEEEDDFEVAAANLICAIRIFQNQRTRLENPNEQTKGYSFQEAGKFISRCRSRLGDLYHLNENYQQAIDIYQQVIADEEKNEGHERNRGLAEIHYMIANSYLYENKQGCQKLAIPEFIKSVKILLQHLQHLNPEDATLYEIPSETKTKVDRFSYLPKASDSEQTKEIKEVINCLLDKIEDSDEQIGIRKQYEALKEKKEEENPNKFSEIKQSTPTVNLGTFGNRKRKPPKQNDE